MNRAANRGEWSELYVLFKLLGDGRIYTADAQMNKLSPNAYLEIIRVIREEVANVMSEYAINDGTIDIYVAQDLVTSISAGEFLREAHRLFKTIRNGRGRSFEVDEATTDFMEQAHITKVKASSISVNGENGGKNDIVMELRDSTTALVYKAGFSIKANGKNPATLFNCATATAFVYRLGGLTDEDAAILNGLNTPSGHRDKQKRLRYLKNHGVELEFVDNKIPPGHTVAPFARNLEILRSDMQQILNLAVLAHYTDERDHTKVSDICKILQADNALGVAAPEYFYKKALEDFLYASFGGLNGTSPWDGRTIVNGGYIVVKEDGEVLAHSSQDTAVFRDFLFQETKFDRPDSSDGKWSYAYAYKDGSDWFMDLNFQVRFI